MKYELRPMDIGEILDRSLKIYLENFGRLLAIALTVAVPAILIVAVFQGSIQGMAEAGPAASDQERLRDVLGGFALLLAMLFSLIVVSGLTQGAMIQAISNLYLGQPADLGQAFSRALSRAVPLICSTMIVGFVVGMGTCACIFPGLYLAAAWFGASAAVVLEDRGPIDSMTRSWHLSRDHRGRIFGCLCIVYAAIIILNGLMSWALHVARQSGFPYFFKITDLAEIVISQLWGALFQPLMAIVIILLYYDLRVRKEAFDLQVLAREMGTAPPPSEDGASPSAPPPAP